MSTTCIHPGCEQLRGRALGYCNAHYLRRTRGKDMDPPIRDVHATVAERFWSKVDKTEGCWNWTGASVRGYGIFRADAANSVAHRVSYAWKHGPIPAGLEVDHICFNRGCVNPDHLRLLSHSLNGQNRASANSNSRSGVRGVYWLKQRNGWMARAMLNRVTNEIGLFPTIEEAEQAVIAWRREHMPASINDQKKAV